jgi:hypothetical protein
MRASSRFCKKGDSLLGYMGHFEADKGRLGFYLDTWAIIVHGDRYKEPRPLLAA